MKRSLAVFSRAAVGAVLTVASTAHATNTWVQQPGTAVDIGVASNDMPWIVAPNGYVEYGLPQTVCGNFYCPPPYNVNWRVLDGGATHIAVNLINDVFIVGAGEHQLWFPQGNQLPSSNEAEAPQADLDSGGWATGNNWFNHYSQWWGVPTYQSFTGPANGLGQIVATAMTGVAGDDSRWVSGPLSFYGIFGSSLLKLTPGIREDDLDGGAGAVWSPFDTGDYQVALFSGTTGSVLNQVPWVLAARNGGPGGFVCAFGEAGEKCTEIPKLAWISEQITYVTDHFVVAGGIVWEWTGDITGHGTGNAATDWQYVIGPTPNAPIAKIAFASQMPAPNAYGNVAVGPSRLWALDTAGNIYVMNGILPSPVK